METKNIGKTNVLARVETKNIGNQCFCNLGAENIGKTNKTQTAMISKLEGWRSEVIVWKSCFFGVYWLFQCFRLLGLENIEKPFFLQGWRPKPLETKLFLALLWFSEDGLKISSPQFGNHVLFGFDWPCQCFLLLGIKNYSNTIPK